MIIYSFVIQTTIKKISKDNVVGIKFLLINVSAIDTLYNALRLRE